MGTICGSATAKTTNWRHHTTNYHVRVKLREWNWRLRPQIVIASPQFVVAPRSKRQIVVINDKLSSHGSCARQYLICRKRRQIVVNVDNLSFHARMTTCSQWRQIVAVTTICATVLDVYTETSCSHEPVHNFNASLDIWDPDFSHLIINMFSRWSHVCVMRCSIETLSHAEIKLASQQYNLSSWTTNSIRVISRINPNEKTRWN